MKVLVVGGAGYIGGTVVDLLIEDCHDVSVFDNLLFEERYLKPVKFIHGDITDTDKLVKIANEFDAVVWLAALVGDPACDLDPLQTVWINQIAVRDFCHSLDAGVKMIFFSTCSVYGINEGMLTEESEVNPLSSYARTKYAAEKYVLARDGIVFRLGTVFGLGDTYSRIRLDLVVNVMTMRAYLDKQIVVNGGDQWRPIISVIDVANFVRRALVKYHSGVYNLSYTNTTIKALGTEIAHLTNVNITYNNLPYQDLRNYMVDGTKAEKVFGYKACVSVEEEVKRIFSLISENRIKDLTSLKYHNGQYLKNHYDTIAAKV